MSTDIRPELSKNSKYYISKDRYYELKHFCLQYPEWKKKLTQLQTTIPEHCMSCSKRHGLSDPVAKTATLRAKYSSQIELIDILTKEAGGDISKWLFMSVTNGDSYARLRCLYDIPCGKDYFYDKYHLFFYLLNKER